MLLLRCFHSDSWLSSRRERNACFLSLFWHFIQSGLSIHSVKLGKRMVLARLAQGLRGSTSSHPSPGTKPVGVSSFVLLHPLKDQPGLKVRPGHSQEEEVSPGFCLSVLWFWFGVFLKQNLKKSCLLLTGWEEGSSHFSLPKPSRFTVQAGQVGWKGARTLTNNRSQIAGFINYSKTKAKPLMCIGKASFLICCSSITSVGLILTLKAEILICWS